MNKYNVQFSEAYIDERGELRVRTIHDGKNEVEDDLDVNFYGF